jgi:hypothetical protein
VTILGWRCSGSEAATEEDLERMLTWIKHRDVVARVLDRELVAMGPWRACTVMIYGERYGVRQSKGRGGGSAAAHRGLGGERERLGVE